MSINVNTISDKYDFEIYAASYAGQPVNNTVMFITKKVEILLNNLSESENCLVFVEDTVVISDDLKKVNCCIQTHNPQMEYAKFVQALFKQREKHNSERKYSLTADGYFVGESVSIGEGSIIEPYCLIDHDVIIGKNARIHSGAKIRNSKIGDNFIAGENCTVGTFGFTMAIDECGNRTRIPTLGMVYVGDDVEIGALSNISCGSGGNTVIDDHVKIDSLVYIGHDVHLSSNVEIPAGAIIGGFDELGKNVYIGINATLRNRIKIGQNAVIGMGAVVTKSVDDNTTVIGNPAKPYEKKV